MRTQADTADLPVGYFGASTGAAAALWAATQPDADISAVVSRGGRPDLAVARLAQVTAPPLLIVGGHDQVVLDLNRRAQAQLRCENRLVVIPGATHLFEEPGTLLAAAEAGRDWFARPPPRAIRSPGSLSMKLALPGDTMLGRQVAARLAAVPSTALFAEEVVAVAHEADLFVLQLEGVISARGPVAGDPLPRGMTSPG